MSRGLGDVYKRQLIVLSVRGSSLVFPPSSPSSPPFSSSCFPRVEFLGLIDSVGCAGSVDLISVVFVSVVFVSVVLVSVVLVSVVFVSVVSIVLFVSIVSIGGLLGLFALIVAVVMSGSVWLGWFDLFVGFPRFVRFARFARFAFPTCSRTTRSRLIVHVDRRDHVGSTNGTWWFVYDAAKSLHQRFAQLDFA